jgi:FlgD Ig-like domain
VIRPLRDLSDRLETPRVRHVVLVGLVLALLVGTAAAFAVAERLKLTRSPVASPDIQRLIGPTCDCPTANAALSFGLRHADRVTASIVDSNGRRIRLLMDDERRPKGRVSLIWDGRNEEGQVVHDGRYRLRIFLHDAHRTITVPETIRVDTRPPRLRLVSAEPRVISPDGDRNADRVVYRYRSSEPGKVQVFVDGTLAVRGRRPAGPAQVRWRGHLKGDLAPVGPYETWITVVDRAGNESTPTRRIEIRIRYVELEAVPRSVARGGTLVFRVDADADRVTWTLRPITRGARGINGVGEPGEFRVSLPMRLLRGVYVLEAKTPAGSDRATLRIRSGR